MIQEIDALDPTSQFTAQIEGLKDMVRHPDIL